MFDFKDEVSFSILIISAPLSIILMSICDVFHLSAGHKIFYAAFVILIACLFIQRKINKAKKNRNNHIVNAVLSVLHLLIDVIDAPKDTYTITPESLYKVYPDSEKPNPVPLKFLPDDKLVLDVLKKMNFISKSEEEDLGYHCWVLYLNNKKIEKECETWSQVIGPKREYHATPEADKKYWTPLEKKVKSIVNRL